MADDQGAQLVQNKEVCTAVRLHSDQNWVQCRIWSELGLRALSKQYLKAGGDKYHNSDVICLYIRQYMIFKLPFTVYPFQ